MKNRFSPTDILLPKFKNDPEAMKKWSTIACDQYTSEPEYWSEAESIVGDAPSCLKITLPEIYLNESEARIKNINKTMSEYMKDTFTEHENAMIYLERTQNNGKVRHGIVGALDLEAYDFTKGAKALVRATEGTVLERIPPRVKIRENAPVELPHIMILIDDPEATVIEPITDKAGELEVAYDFDLMLGGGHSKGYFLPDAEKSRVNDALEALCEKAAIEQSCDDPLVFAVGDGNHSLASAKAFWEQIKPTLSEAERECHPARFALCEIVNIHDAALEFEPIYRVLFGVDPYSMLTELENYFEALPEDEAAPAPQTFEYIAGNITGKMQVKHPTSMLPVGTLQAFLDDYVKTHEGVTIDYIHGIESTKKLASKENSVGFIFNGMEKSELFPTVVADGALPRKTFSMGEADDKRFYLEARKIIK